MSVIYDLFKMLLDLFPDDPILGFIEEFKGQAWLGYINYFVPVSFMVNVTTVWVGVVFAYRIAKVAVNFVQKLLK